MESFNIDNTKVQLMMAIKLEQLQRESLPSLTYQNLEDYCVFLWKKALPDSLHECADMVMQIQAKDLVRFLTQQAIAEGSREKLDDFSDLIGGE